MLKSQIYFWDILSITCERAPSKLPGIWTIRTLVIQNVEYSTFNNTVHSLDRAPALVSSVSSHDRGDPPPSSELISLAERGNDPRHSVNRWRSWDRTYTEPEGTRMIRLHLYTHTVGQVCSTVR